MPNKSKNTPTEQYVLDLSPLDFNELEMECRNIPPADLARMHLDQGEWDRSRYRNNPNLAPNVKGAAEDLLGIGQIIGALRIHFKGAEITDVSAGVRTGIVDASVSKDLTTKDSPVRKGWEVLGGVTGSGSFQPENPALDVPTDGPDLDAARKRAVLEAKLSEPISPYDQNPVCAAVPRVKGERSR